MPQENNYESRLEELNKRETEIRNRLAQIAEERTTNMGAVADIYGVNATDVDLGADTERENLQEELVQVLNDQKEIFEARKQAKITEDKQKREERNNQINRNGKLQQAYKFFTYLDTATTQGYNLDGLTEDEVLKLYDDFMTKPEYEQMKKETLEKALRNDREIIIPTLKADTKENKEEYPQIQDLRARADEIRQRISEISKGRTTDTNAIADVFGVNATDVDLGENEERNKLQAELDKILDQIALLEGVKSIDYKNERKAEAAIRQEQKGREDKLQQAYKFFTYLDTATTKGYSLDGLTEDEILKLYDDFMTKPEYEKTKNETIERALKNDRVVVIPLPLQKAAKGSQNNSVFDDSVAAQVRNLVSLSDLPHAKAEETNENSSSAEEVEETPASDIPPAALASSVEAPTPTLLNRAREWITNHKGRTAMIVGAAVALGIAVGTAIHYAVTGDSTVMQGAAQVDSGSIASQVSNAVSAEAAKHAADIADQAKQLIANTDTSSLTDMFKEALKQSDGTTIDIASNAYDALSGNTAPMSQGVQIGDPVSAFDIANNTQIPLESLKNMSAEQLQNISVLLGDADLKEALKGVTDPEEINRIISSNINHAQGYIQVPTDVVNQLAQGGHRL